MAVDLKKLQEAAEEAVLSGIPVRFGKEKGVAISKKAYKRLVKALKQADEEA